MRLLYRLKWKWPQPLQNIQEDKLPTVSIHVASLFCFITEKPSDGTMAGMVSGGSSMAFSLSVRFYENVWKLGNHTWFVSLFASENLALPQHLKIEQKRHLKLI